MWKTEKKVAFIFVLACGFAIGLAQRAEAWIANGYTWTGSHPRIPYYVSTNLSGNVPWDGTLSDAETAIQSAASKWKTQGGSEFAFTYGGTTSVDTVADDGVNAVIYSDQQCPTGNGCVAIAYYHVTGNVFHGFDIVLYKYQGTSGYQLWWSTKVTLQGWEIDVESQVLHEFGHTLGLNHSDSIGVVMDTGCAPGCISRNLFNDDKQGAKGVNGTYTNEGFWANTTTPMHGTTLTLTLNYPEAANQAYVVLLTLTGTTGFPLYNVTPTDSRMLYIDPNFFPTENYPDLFHNFVGVLNASGQATATLDIPNNANLAGLDLNFTVVTLDSQAQTGLEDVGVGVTAIIQ